MSTTPPIQPVTINSVAAVLNPIVRDQMRTDTDIDTDLVRNVYLKRCADRAAAWVLMLALMLWNWSGTHFKHQCWCLVWIEPVKINEVLPSVYLSFNALMRPVTHSVNRPLEVLCGYSSCVHWIRVITCRVRISLHLCFLCFCTAQSIPVFAGALA